VSTQASNVQQSGSSQVPADKFRINQIKSSFAQPPANSGPIGAVRQESLKGEPVKIMTRANFHGTPYSVDAKGQNLLAREMEENQAMFLRNHSNVQRTATLAKDRLRGIMELVATTRHIGWNCLQQKANY